MAALVERAGLAVVAVVVPLLSMRLTSLVPARVVVMVGRAGQGLTRSRVVEVVELGWAAQCLRILGPSRL